MIKFRIFLFLLPLSSLAENQQQSFPSPKNDVNSRSFQQSSSISSINSQDVKQSSSFSSSSSAHETDGTLRQSISSSAIGNPAVQSVMTQFVPASQLPNPQQQRHFQGSSSSLFQETTVPGFVSCGRGGSVITSDVQQTENGVPSGKMQINVNGVMYNKGPVIAIGDQCVYHVGFGLLLYFYHLKILQLDYILPDKTLKLLIFVDNENPKEFYRFCKFRVVKSRKTITPGQQVKNKLKQFKIT